MPKGELRVCLDEADAFLDVARSLAEQNRVEIGLSRLIYPYVVNLAFSCELFLKAVMIAHSASDEFERGHSLRGLYDHLGEKDRDGIRQACSDRMKIAFDVALDEFDTAFEDWRYALEIEVEIHYREFLRFAEALASHAHDVAHIP